MQDAPRPAVDYRPSPTPPARKPGPSRHLPDWLAVGMALAAAAVGAVAGYTQGLDDTKANATAKAASRPVERKPREKSKPRPTTLTIPGRYAVGPDIAFGEWLSKLDPADDGGFGCEWYVYRADGEVIDMSDYQTSTAPNGYTGPKLSRYATVFEFEPGCAPFELVR